jgi:hypothetical protein
MRVFSAQRRARRKGRSNVNSRLRDKRDQHPARDTNAGLRSGLTVFSYHSLVQKLRGTNIHIDLHSRSKPMIDERQEQRIAGSALEYAVLKLARPSFAFALGATFGERQLPQCFRFCAANF